MKRVVWLLSTLTFLGAVTQVGARQPSAEEALKSMKWRAIGPANMGGRVTDIDGVPGDPHTFYVSGADGGVFKTTNGGVTFEALFTDQRAYSVGALAVAPSDPNVLWLGSGEGDPRNSVGYGNGVYRSNDGGKTWTHLGLDNTERIKRIVVDPRDPDVAYVAALGHEWGANPERGVFRTRDGGKTWDKMLYIDEDTGCSDIAMENDNPRILYAGMWTFRRKPWRFDGGGKETALYRSMDGGETWKKLDGGLPKGPMARIGVAVAQSEPNIVYMITEYKKEGTLFRSEDRGDSWRMVNDERNINFRPFYYSDIHVDPTNANVVFSLSGGLFKSTDGGRNFQRIARGVHGDHQSMWIDPENSERVLSGSDGGYQVSYDGGATFDIINNVELSQFYQLDVDDLDPYNVYGGLQDNGTWVGPSNSLRGAGILKRDWRALAGGDGYYAIPIPGSEHEVYANLQGGVIFHVDSRTGNVRNIHPYPKITGSAGDAIFDHKYRFNWDSPIHISPHDPNTVFFGGNVVFKSTNKGYDWTEISPDLTTNDKSKQQTSGGEIYQDNTAAEFHCSILTIAESPVEKGVLWVGTDDGNIQISRDGGESWTNVKDNVSGLPEFAWVAKIHASEHDAGTAFVAVDHHRMDDFTPHAYMTTDYGQSWKDLSKDLPQDDYVKVIRQDPHYPDVLYVGMEHGVYASWDTGDSWTRINNNLPPASARDLRVQPTYRDLVVGTHGRGVWILDDIRPLQELSKAQSKSVHLFESRPTTRWHIYGRHENMGQRTWRGENPAYGAYVNFYLAEDASEAVKVEIKNAAGDLVRTLTDSAAKAGVNRIVWDLRGKEAEGGSRRGRGFRFGSARSRVSPGMYTATLHAEEEVLTTSITVKADPRIDMTQADYEAQEKAAVALIDLTSEANALVNKSEALLKQLKDLQAKAKMTNGATNGSGSADDQMSSAIKSASKDLNVFLDTMRRPPPAMNYRQKPQLREEIRSLMRAVDGASARPTTSQLARLDELRQEVVDAKGRFGKIVSGKIAEINEMAKSLPQLSVGGGK